MKKLLCIFITTFIFNNCGSNKYSYKTDHLKKNNIERNIVSIYENEKAYVLIADNNDLIEVFKEPYNFIKSCRKIQRNKKQKFKVVNLSEMIQAGSIERTYTLNDSVILDYNVYYFIPTFKKYCYDKQDVPIVKKKIE